MQEKLPFYRSAPNAGPGYGDVPDTTRWVTQCSRGRERLEHATDRNAETFWSPSGTQKAGDSLGIDLGDVVLDMARLVLDDDGCTNIHFWDSPGPMWIEGSVDGNTWELVGEARGDPFAVIDVTWEPRPLRYLRATLTEETARGGYINWRIYEAYVYRKPPA